MWPMKDIRFNCLYKKIGIIRLIERSYMRDWLNCSLHRASSIEFRTEQTVGLLIWCSYWKKEISYTNPTSLQERVYHWVLAPIWAFNSSVSNILAISSWNHTLFFPKIWLRKKKWKFPHVLHYKYRKKSNLFDFRGI